MCLLWNINVHCQTPLASFMGRGIIKIPLPPFCITCSSHLIPEGTQAGCLESRIEERHRLNEGLSSFWMISKLYQNHIFVSYFLGSIKLQGRKGKGQKGPIARSAIAIFGQAGATKLDCLVHWNVTNYIFGCSLTRNWCDLVNRLGS